MTRMILSICWILFFSSSVPGQESRPLLAQPLAAESSTARTSPRSLDPGTYVLHAVVFEVSIDSDAQTSESRPTEVEIAQKLLDEMQSIIDRKLSRADIAPSDDEAIAKTVAEHLRLPLDSARIVLISRPSVTSQLGTEASVQVAQDADLQYFERLNESTFELHSMRVRLGIDMKWNATEKEELRVDKNVRLLEISPFSLSTTAIDKRVKLEGVALDVGKPSIQRRSVQSELQLRENELALVELPLAEGRSAFAILHCKLSKQ